MIVSRTPLRISFVGGGSDLKEYYQHGFGAVLSTAINKHIYIFVHKSFDDVIRVNYSKNEIVDNIDDLEHDIVREAMKLSGVTKGVSIAYAADLPAKSLASGLGASSSFAVGILNALYAYKSEKAAPGRLAEEASKIEIDILGKPIGKQDQYAVAFGGLNYIKFNKDESVIVRSVNISTEDKELLGRNLLLFYTGTDTKSVEVLSEQRSKTRDNLAILSKMVSLSGDLKTSLENSDLSKFGSMLRENWNYKKMLASEITNPIIDDYYNKAMSAGAVGGKILGSGGGGFLLFYCESQNQMRLRKVLPNLKEMPFDFEPEGSRIIYSD